MTHSNARRGVLQAGLALAAANVLPPARACDFMTTTLRVTHPWTRATAPGAATAVVCMKFDEVAQSDRLVSVASPVASGAEMSGPAAGQPVSFDIPEGQESYLSEAGVHVRLTGLRVPLEMGRTYPLVLGFEKGGSYNTVLTVDYVRFG